MKERPILFNSLMVRALLAGAKTQTRRVIEPQPEYDADMLGGVFMFPPPKGVGSDTAFAYAKDPANSSLLLATCPQGQSGDRLWVREGFASGFKMRDGYVGQEPFTIYRATDEGFQWYDGADDCPVKTPWKPSIHMPRAACRLLLEMTAVRVERLQDISEADAVAEGVETIWTADELLQYPELSKYATPAEAGWINYLWHGRREANAAHVTNWPHQFSDYSTAAGSFSSLWASIKGPESWAANPWVWVEEFKVVEGGLSKC